MQPIKKFCKYLINRPDLIFVILALIFGTIYIFKLAPLRGTDEFTHFSRVYQISDGTLWEQKVPNNNYGGSLPTNVNNMINDFRVLTYQGYSKQYLSNKQKLINKYDHITQPGSSKQTADFTSSYLYQPWDYAADLIGLMLAKMLHLPLLWYIYLARITSLVCFIILTWLAIRILPTGKWFLTVLALAPTSLTQAATVSADGLLNSLSWLIFAMTLAILAKKLKFKLKTQILMVALMVFMCILKNGYMLVGLFPLVIPYKYFSSQRAARIWRTCMIGLFAIVSSTFLLLQVKYVNKTPTVLYAGLNVNPHEQIQYILSHPITYAAREIWWLFTNSFDIIYLGLVGMLTNNIVILPISIIMLVYFCLYLTYERVKPSSIFKENSRNLRIAAITIFVGTYLLITTAQYINASGVGSTILNGFWGRYLLPIAPFLLIFPITSKTRQQIKFTPLLKRAIVVIILICLTTTMFYAN